MNIYFYTFWRLRNESLSFPDPIVISVVILWFFLAQQNPDCTFMKFQTTKFKNKPRKSLQHKFTICIIVLFIIDIKSLCNIFVSLMGYNHFEIKTFINKKHFYNGVYDYCCFMRETIFIIMLFLLVSNSSYRAHFPPTLGATVEYSRKKCTPPSSSPRTAIINTNINIINLNMISGAWKITRMKSGQFISWTDRDIIILIFCFYLLARSALFWLIKSKEYWNRMECFRVYYKRV